MKRAVNLRIIVPKCCATCKYLQALTYPEQGAESGVCILKNGPAFLMTTQTGIADMFRHICDNYRATEDDTSASE